MSPFQPGVPPASTLGDEDEDQAAGRDRVVGYPRALFVLATTKNSKITFLPSPL